MRVTTVQRILVGNRNKRLDPPFYFGRIDISELVEREDARHVLLGDLLAELHEGTRLPLKDNGIPLLRLSNLQPCEVDFQNLRYVDPEAAGSWTPVHEDDVLFTRSADPFRAAVVPPDAPMPLTVSPEITILRPRPGVLPEYLAAVLSSTRFARVLQDLAYRRSPGALPRLRLADVARLPIPLPRRSIQEKIRRAYLHAAALTRQAREEMVQIIRAIYAEIDTRIGRIEIPEGQFSIQSSKLEGRRWDVAYSKGRILRESLLNTEIMRPLLQLARPVPSTLKGIDENDLVLAVQADAINETTFLVEGAEPRRLSHLSSRMRQPLAVGDVLLCTTGSGNQIAYLDEALEEAELPILGSATFTALRFNETPRYFAIALSHPMVRHQLKLVSSGSVQRFVNKPDLDELLVPCLSTVWREDFDSRASRVFERRREALTARTKVLAVAESFIAEDWMS